MSRTTLVPITPRACGPTLLAGIVALVGAAFVTPALGADGGQGEAAFNNACRTCHSWKAGDNRLGPHLSGLIGRKAGAAEGFAYSPSLKGAAITWDEATLDKFIANPDAVAPGNTMKPYTGIADAALRKSIIDFLKTNPQ